MIRGKNRIIFLIFIWFCLISAVAVGQEDEERGQLLERQKRLSERIETLRQEQDFLLFQKSLYASDSKYLILRVSEKTGQLKYKNRVLRSFHFSSNGKIQRGTINLTRKIEGAEPRYLIFGNSLVLRTKRFPADGAGIPFFIMGKKDFKAVFYTLENGAPAYLLP